MLISLSVYISDRPGGGLWVRRTRENIWLSFHLSFHFDLLFGYKLLLCQVAENARRARRILVKLGFMIECHMGAIRRKAQTEPMAVLYPPNTIHLQSPEGMTNITGLLHCPPKVRSAASTVVV
jgi:hypothetical protein